jgi:hypothetical protein
MSPASLDDSALTKTQRAEKLHHADGGKTIRIIE